MARELPDELTGLTEEEKAERKQRLVDESRETRRELEAEQEELLDSLDEEHGGDLIETRVTLPGGNLAHLEAVMNGELINRISHVDSMLAELDDPEPGDMQNIERSMDEAASVLADVTVEAKYSKEVFYEIYVRYGPDAIGEHVGAAFDAIEEEVKRQAGAADGFRKK
ncbi:hypothetical protein HALLA_12130 [Halostagnicola larsenii XH-48]|uniref:Uncharacterized protein n=1 Tax=Halostagnicola larsenii XH-48 TaxID=797299 RepID=W0JVA5_9EURY|nr:hypothetical protein [Halostagnicola larsenii]AHG00924.1 hypothetical protein HALLA_11830 [Halostagnicola larsenii XH-48]AHG00973.1 hypothetical protein HALLA_12130 [Halostagnicola larsenii XH-48]